MQLLCCMMVMMQCRCGCGMHYCGMSMSLVASESSDVEHACMCNRETVPSGALTLDIALGGGFPKGRIIEVVLSTCPLCF